MAGIYIHIPFCKQACYYCDFHFSTSLKHKKKLLVALETELLLRKSELDGQQIRTIYFGGGTPSILNTEEITRILDLIYTKFNVDPTAEITLEANPDDLTVEKLNQLSNTKINRLSIGVQSFFEDDLQFMNRAHTAKESITCIKEASKHFDNITIDLIYGVPNMSSEKWQQNLNIAFELGVPHISSYALTVEEKTALSSFIKKGTVKPLDETLAQEHFNMLVAETSKHGFVHYEISNFGKPLFFSKHNTAYWQGETYVGIGPSAHSFNKTQRSWNISNNQKYIQSIEKGVLPCETETLSDSDRFNEYIMTGLRTIYGVSLAKVLSDFGDTTYKTLLKNVEKFISQGLLEIKDNTLLTSQKGKFLADGIASDLFEI